MISQLIANWKTTSAGVGMIITAVVHLVFAVKNNTADESTWTTTLLAVIGGVGLVAAGDAAQSQKQVQSLSEKTASAVESGDTSVLKRDK